MPLPPRSIIFTFVILMESGKTIEQISVQNICRIAEISRPSFYTHYEDINDMVMKIEKEKAENIQVILMNEAIPSFQILKRYFEYLKENRIFYIAYFSSGDNAHISQPMMDTYLKYHREYHTKTGLDEESTRYLMTFFSAGLKAVAFRWLKGGCKKSPAEMAALVKPAFSM